MRPLKRRHYQPRSLDYKVDKWEEGERDSARLRGIDRWPMKHWIEATPMEYRVTYREYRAGKRTKDPEFMDC